MRDFDPTASEFISSGYLQNSRPGGQYYDPTTIMAGASLANGIMGADAASSAADAQREATQQSNDRLERQYNQTRTDLAPWRSTGGRALSRLSALLGLPDEAGGGDYNAIRQALLPQYTKTVAGTNPRWEYFGDGMDGGVTQMPPSDTQQIDEAGLNAAIQQRMAQGQSAQSDPAYGSLLKPFTGADLASEPGYQFGLEQGQQALDRKAAAAGGYFSGAALKGAARYATDYAGTKYGEAFNRDAANKDRAYNFLSGQSAAGQNSAAQTGTMGTQIASQVANNQSSLGNALGAAAIAGSNAWSGAINGGLNNYMGQQYLDAYRQRNPLTQAIYGGNTAFGPSPMQPTLGSAFDQYLARE